MSERTIENSEGIPERNQHLRGRKATSGRLLHDEVASELREIIITGELLPGERIPERQLCERFEISRTPLREALKVLAAEGLVDLLPNRGSRVSQLTAEGVRELSEVMSIVESLTGDLACLRITDEQIAEIRARHYQMEAHYYRRELAPYLRLNQQIHDAIIAAAGNSTLASIYRSPAGRIRSSGYFPKISQARWDQAIEEHRQILDALCCRDGPRLGALLKQHLIGKCERVAAMLEESHGQSAGSAKSAAPSDAGTAHSSRDLPD
jgi:DNA-binding GntR family transcriptional regulator